VFKYIFAFLLLVVSANVFASSKMLSNYEDVLKAISHGEHLQAVANFNTCLPSAHDPIQLGTITFEHFLVYSVEKNGKKMNVIGSSNIILVHKNNKGYQFEYVKARIFSDNSVEIFQQYLNPKNYSPLTKGSSFMCRLNNKKDSLEGVAFYVIGSEI
jgi:hypothetical protein